MGLCFKCISLSVLVVAVLVGLLVSGVLSNHTPLFQWLDDLPLSRGKVLKGMIPVMHKGTPYGFTFDDLHATDLTDHVILVTGGNIGLGYWTALHLAKQNAKVIIGCRSSKKCESAASEIKKATGKSIDPMTVDLSSFKSILAFTDKFKQKYKSLDSLILNAGIGMTGFSLTTDGLESIIGVNHFGHFLLTQELLPLIDAAAKAKGVATVVSVSSGAHYSSYPEGILSSVEAMADESRFTSRGAYAQSKLANVLFAQELAERLKSKNILANSVHPGGVDTQMNDKLVGRIFAPFGENVINTVRDTLAGFSWTAEEAALSQLYLAVGKKLKESKTSGKYFHPIARLVEPDPHTKDKALQKRLWKMTEEFIDKRVKELAK